MATLAKLNVLIGANVRGLRSGLNQAEKTLIARQKVFKKVGSDMTKAISLPFAAFAGFAVKSAADYEQSMNGVLAVTKGAEAQFESLKDKAKELGRTTSFSASQSAQAIEMLGRNGLTANQILDGAADASIRLAEATKADLSIAADIATDAMAQFGIESKNMMGVVDLIAGTTSNSKFAIEDFQLAMAQAGGVAGAVGVNFKDFTTSIAAISPSFASGSDAGTSFKTFLTRLVPQSKEAAELMKQLGIITSDGANQFFNASGEMRGMAEVSEVLKNAFGGLSEEQINMASKTIFGTDAMRAGIMLAKTGSGEFEKLAASINEVSATEMAEKRLMGFNGAMKRMQRAFESLQIAFAESGILDFLTKMVEKLAKLFGAFSKISPVAMKVVTVIGLIAAVIGPAIVVIAQLKIAIVALGGAAAIAGTAMTVLFHPVTLITVAVASLAAMFKFAWEKSEKFRGIILGLGKTIKEVARLAWEGLKAMGNGLKSLISGDFNDAAESFAKVLDGLDPSSGFNAGAKIGAAFAEGYAEGLSPIEEEARKAAEAARKALLNTLFIDNDVFDEKFDKLFGPSYASTQKKKKNNKRNPLKFGSGRSTALSGSSSKETKGDRDAGINSTLDNLTNSFGKNNTLPDTLAAVSGGVSDVNGRISELSQNLADNTVPLLNTMHERFMSFPEMLERIGDAGGVMGEAISGAMGAMAQSVDDGASSFKELATVALQSARKIVGAAIRKGVAEAMANMMGNGPLGLVLAPAVGIAAQAMFNKALKGLKIPAFAEGGFVSGPTFAMVGEKPGSKGEFIIPYEKMGSLINGAVGGGRSENVNVRGQLVGVGDQLIGVIETGGHRMSRSRGF